MLGRAEKGIILTTSGFSNAAIQEASREGAPQVELVDGDKLVEGTSKNCCSTEGHNRPVLTNT